MSENGSGSLLLPLGIGAGLLFWMMKKKAAAQQSPAATEATENVVPEITEADASTPQIDPAPAPSYTQTMAKSSPEEEGAENAEEEAETDNTSEAATEEDAESSDTEDSNSDDSGGSSYTPYVPKSTINTNPQPAPAYTSVNQQVAPKIIMVNGKPAMSHRAKLLAIQKQRQLQAKKSLRFRSDQARMLVQRQQGNKMFIGNSKPRIGIKKPQNYHPLTTATKPFIRITANKQVLRAAKPVMRAAVSSRQTSIFPLRFGMNNVYVKEVQRSLGVSPTGYFGAQTKAAIQKRFRVTEINETLYKQITGRQRTTKTVPKQSIAIQRLNTVKKLAPTAFKLGIRR